jgi:hypothetical protein
LKPAGGGTAAAPMPRTRSHALPAVTVQLATDVALRTEPILAVRGILSPCKITVKCAPCGRVLWMALRAPLDCDLPRQTIGTYRQDGRKVMVHCEPHAR